MGRQNRELQNKFGRHAAIWHEILQKGDRGALVLKEGCVTYHHHPYPHCEHQCPPNGITLLGGFFKGSAQQTQKLSVDNLQLLDVLAPLKVGIQTFRQDMRVKVLAYWVPLGFAKSICEALRSCQKGSVGSIDTWLQQHATHFLWPSAFGDEEDSDLWCDSEMRSLAARHSKCKLPNLGGSVEVVQVWQKLLLQDRGLEARSDWHEET